MKKVAGGFSPVIAIDRKAGKPLHRQIYDGYRAAIVLRNLCAGQRIPSTRALASELGISRIPVLDAYAQLLAEGYFETRTGAGTLVSSSIPDQLTSIAYRGAGQAEARCGPRPVSARSALLPPHESAPWIYGWGAFSVGQLAFDQFPFQAWSSLVARHCRSPRASSLNYAEPMGSKGFRETIATYLRAARAVHCDARQIMVVSGSQQALDISARVLLDPRSRVWVEEPCYQLLRYALSQADCRLIPVPVDGQGLDVAAGIKRCRQARAAFVTPSHQFPLGATLSASRRLQLLEWAQSAGAWIVEDDYDSEYRYQNMPIASLQGLDHNGRVIYIGTFSKTPFPSLNKCARLSAMLLGLMFFLWVVLVHAPRVAAHLRSGDKWNSTFVALAMSGIAFLAVGATPDQKGSGSFPCRPPEMPRSVPVAPPADLTLKFTAARPKYQSGYNQTSLSGYFYPATS